MSFKIEDYERQEIARHVGRHPGAAKLVDRGERPEIAVGYTFGGKRVVRVNGDTFTLDEILDHPDRDVIEYLLLANYASAIVG